MISGFPNETEEDQQNTLSLMEYVKYDFGFMFMYSERPGTPAAKKLDDNIPDDVKKHRLKEVVALQQQHGLYRTQQFVGQIVEVLIEKESKKSKKHWSGRNQQNTVVVFPKENFKVGDFVEHAIFGQGKIMVLSGTGENQRVGVVFKDGTKKKLIVKYANLTKIN